MESSTRDNRQDNGQWTEGQLTMDKRTTEVKGPENNRQQVKGKEDT